MKKKELPSNIEGVKKAHGRKKKHVTFASLFALLVIICTVCALMIPASALETEASLPEGAQVPDGYTQQYTVNDEENGFTVTVYAAEGVISEGAQLSVQLLGEEDDAYTQAEEALALGTDGGFAALDISFEEEDGSEIEPDGDVYVVINAQGLLPEEADADTIAVQHHAESEDGITVETVADTAEDTQGIVAVADESTVQAAFSVSSFSTFTITWSTDADVEEITEETTEESAEETTEETAAGTETYAAAETLATSLTITSANNSITFSGGGTARTSNHSWTVSESGIVSLNNTNGATVTVTALNEGTVTLTHTYTASGTTYTENYTVVVETDESGNLDINAYVKVYVYVAGSNISDDCLELLGIDESTLDQSGYFPAGEIYLNIDYFDSNGGLSTQEGVGLINNGNDWEELLASLSEMDTTTLIDQTNFNYSGLLAQYKVDYTVNQNNNVGDYLSQAIVSYGSGWGSQSTALFHWWYDSSASGQGHYGFEDQTVMYHLDLHFTTNTITFIYGNNGIGTGSGRDGTEADSRTYITGSEIQEPSITIPDGYYFDGFYTDPDCTIPWDGIGDSLTEDTKVYIKLTKTPLNPDAEMTLTIQKEIEWADGTESTTVTDMVYSFTVSTTDSTVAGETYETSDGTTITFSSEPNDAGYYTATVSLTATTKNGVDGIVRIYDLPAENDNDETISYTITENTAGVAIEGYIFTGVTYSGGSGEDGNAITPQSGSTTSAYAVLATNTYEKEENFSNITIKKTDDDGNTLGNAQFMLYYTEDGTNYYYCETTADGEITVTWVETEDDGTPLTSDSDGILTFYNLDISKTYYLEEIKAPDGYLLLTDTITIQWDGETLKANYTSGSDSLVDDDYIVVKNQTGQELPETGGTGTAIYTIGGAVLMLAAAAIGIYSMKRKHKAQ